MNEGSAKPVLLPHGMAILWSRRWAEPEARIISG